MIKLKNILKESGLARLAQHMENHDCGTITAFRSKEGCAQQDDKEYTLQDNLKRNKQLLANLQSMGYGVTSVKGAYIENYKTPDAKEVTENVFFVVDLKDDGKIEQSLRKLGEQYEQDSILFIPKGGKGSELIGTNHCENSYPGYGKKISFNDRKLGGKGEFMTKVSGRPFVFESNLLEQVCPNNYYEDANIMGKWATKEITKRNWKDIDI